MRRNERGTILIEFVGSFLLFVLLILSILSLVNLTTMQARMHYALTQSANTLSLYGYALHATGLDAPLIHLASGAESVRREANASIDEVNDVLENINSLNLPGLARSAGTATDRFSSWADDTRENPQQTLQLLLQYALQEGAGFGFEQLLRPLLAHHLANGEMSGDAYLRSVGVDGTDSLEFYTLSMPGYTPAGEGETVGSLTGLPGDDSALLDGNANVKIVVQYEMEYDFMGLPLPFEQPKLKVTQSVMTKMWLGGRGEGYRGERI
jgi:hypothetical protein